MQLYVIGLGMRWHKRMRARTTRLSDGTRFQATWT